MLAASFVAMMWGSSASADRYDRDDDREDRRRTVYRGDHRDYRNTRVVRHRPRYTGPVRSTRRVVHRKPIYVSNGVFTFHSGRTYRYSRPVIRERYYNVRVRPPVVVEHHPDQYGYVWTNGSWSWGGSEWQWQSGHYEPDTSYSTYYDDDSYE